MTRHDLRVAGAWGLAPTGRSTSEAKHLWGLFPVPDARVAAARLKRSRACSQMRPRVRQVVRCAPVANHEGLATAMSDKSGHWLNLPNKITLARLVIAVALFALLSILLIAEDRRWGWDRSLILNIAVVTFVICVATDWLDGWLARRWGMVTVFGRIADPFVDKIVICGSFIYLIEITPLFVKPWIAVIIVAREFLVTSLRGYLESQGTPFGARWGGKIKMVVQSIAIPACLFYEANLTGQETAIATGFYWFCFGLVILTLVSTLSSAWDYISLSRRALHANPNHP